MEQGYSICLNEWALDETIKNELGLLLIISSLCAEKGYCYASNEYLAKQFNTTSQTISRKLRILEEKKYINIKYEKLGCLVKNREIRLTKLITVINKNDNRTINKNVKENNISINNNIKENIKRKYFDDEELNDLFNEFLELRKKLKCKNTDRAITLLLKELNKYPDDIKKEMINNSIMGSWKSVYPLKNTKRIEPIPEWFGKEIKNKIDEEAEEFERQVLGKTKE